MLKHIHMLSAVISISLFVLRGVWLLSGSGMMNRKWVRIVPHVNDTVLLVSAGVLAWNIGQAPLSHGWLTAKVIALLVYIGLGLATFRFARNDTTRRVCFLAAILTFVYIVTVARTRDPLGLLVWLGV